MQNQTPSDPNQPAASPQQPNAMPPQPPTSPQQTNDPLPQPQAGILPEQPPKKKKGLLIAIVVILLLIVLGVAGTVAAHMSGFFRIPFLSQDLEPDAVIERMFASLSSIASAEYSFEMRLLSEARDPNIWAPNGSAPSENQPDQEAIRRDQQLLDDVYILLTEIHLYKEEGGGYGIYYPRTLIEVAPEDIRTRTAQSIQNGIYSYGQEEDGTNFRFAVQLETAQAVNAFNQAVANQVGSDHPAPLVTEGATITMAKENRPVIIQIPDDQEFTTDPLQILPAEFDFYLNITGHENHQTENGRLGRLALDGRLKMDGTTFEGRGEVVMADDTFYVRVNEFPALGPINISPIRGQWIQIEADEVSQEINHQADQELIIEHYKLMLQMVRENNLIKVLHEHPKARESGRDLYHYEIDVDVEDLAEFYRDFTEEAERQFGNNALITYEEDVYNELNSQEFREDYDEFGENVSIELWIDDQTFHPVKLSFDGVGLPDDTTGIYNDKQIRFTMTLSLDKINEPVEIEIPTDYITIQDAVERFLGPEFDMEFSDEDQFEDHPNMPTIRGIIDRLEAGN